jgi:mono/diheme cytochrome c family protein
MTAEAERLCERYRRPQPGGDGQRGWSSCRWLIRLALLAAAQTLAVAQSLAVAQPLAVAQSLAARDLAADDLAADDLTADDLAGNDRAGNDRARMILRQRCVVCHGATEQAGELRLDSEAGLRAGGGRGPLLNLAADGAVDAASLIIRSIDGSAPELAMPPEDPLSAAELETLVPWLLAGAPWPNDGPDGDGPDGNSIGGAPPEAAREHFRYHDVWQRADHPLRKVFADDRWEHWAWRPRQAAEPPAVEQSGWVFNQIDQFLMAGWEAAGVLPAADIDRRQWLRRLSFDLTGLPPTPQEMEEFLSEDDPAAYQRQIDRLLAHPGYGPHVARMWLDTVRYSDSNGFDWDEFRPQAWRYRDYVIAAFQRDKPYDRFVMEQLSGDESVSGPPRDDAERQALIATGFLRMGPHDNAASLFDEQDRSRDELLTDLVETTGSAFLALTLSCCRCHDHKTDALLQADHFRLRAFFAGVTFADDWPIDSADSYALLMRDLSDVPPTYLLAQGDYRRPTLAVEPGFPALWNPYDATIEPVAAEMSSGRRSALAGWLVHRDNPLTARVIVNRLWQGCFGEGLVATPNDFGITGAPPSDLALLDWLAEELIRSGWSLKHIQRLIVSSHAYRQRAVPAGPDGQPLGSRRHQLKRLTAEQLRDAVLAVSGQLLPHLGGPPVWPQLPPEILQANPAFLDDNETRTKGWYPSPPEQQAVRTIFLVQKRTVTIPLLETFDLPDNSVSCGSRQQSLVAPQALTLLNGDLMETAAKALAGRVEQAKAGADKIVALYRLTLQREPSELEWQACQLYLAEYDLPQLARVLMNLNEFVFLD